MLHLYMYIHGIHVTTHFVKYIFLVEDKTDVHVKQYIIDIIYSLRPNRVHILPCIYNKAH